MKRLNILELHRTINEKTLRKHECYEKVLDICHKKISIAAENKNLRCMIEVPEYVCGYPLYNITDCLKYIINALQINGFIVKYYFPKVLYISWDFDEIKQDNTIKPKVVNTKPVASFTPTVSYKNKPAPLLTSSLMSSNPQTAFNLKSSGKYELNI